MNIEFKNCHKETSNSLQRLLEVAREFIITHGKIMESTAESSIHIKNGEVIIGLPTANSDWMIGVNLLSILICSSSIAYVRTVDQMRFNIRLRTGRTISELIDLIENNKEVDIKICK